MSDLDKCNHILPDMRLTHWNTDGPVNFIESFCKCGSLCAILGSPGIDFRHDWRDDQFSADTIRMRDDMLAERGLPPLPERIEILEDACRQLKNAIDTVQRAYPGVPYVTSALLHEHERLGGKIEYLRSSVH